ncbi:MAG: pirin family protein, partial [Bdellovibrionales bacterium]|nr:pirin family protein [Bdellovibrionales bacterium]NQZ18632.1 pirin family protein [Bdellovibrionales bacterium]
HMGPAEFKEGLGINVRPHPHINLATVTYLFEGEIYHRDSLGNSLPIHPGDINLMIAGKGITHSERETDEAQSQSRKLHGLQLWKALPIEHEEVDPEFIHYDASETPSAQTESYEVRVMMGQAYNLKSPVKTFGDTLYVEAKVNESSTFPLPEVEERAIYLLEGQIEIGDQKIEPNSLTIINTTCTSLKVTKKSLFVIVGGEKYENRFIEWNFVSSRKKRIDQAKEDWREGRFPKVPGDEKEFIPLP